jgi:hypothetical protein
MANEPNLEDDTGQPMVYQITIKGHLSTKREEWFAGLAIKLEKDGNTLLTGTVTDQAALHGILKKIRDLGMPLLSVNSIGPDQKDMLENKQMPHE